jgi:cytochrome c-type biogenesis protein CcmF
VLGVAGSAFNKDAEQELAMGQKMQLGGYTLVCQSYTQDDNDNYASQSAIIDVYRGNEKITTLYPERRFYKANQQPATIVANRSTPLEDLYLVYAGDNPANDHPIIRAYVKPLVMWIWIGWLVLVAGTGLALIPNMQSAELKQRQRQEAMAMEAGD